jgi:uncharacterized protein (TIGR00106 family)
MVLMELSVVPLGTGESVGAAVARCVQLIVDSGLPHELHAMGTIVEGELEELLELMQRCIETTAESAPRVSCVAKIDYRPGRRDGLTAKVASVRAKLRSDSP